MRRAATVVAISAVGALALAGCAAPVAPASNEAAVRAPTVQEATELAQITQPHEATGGTLLEGPTFDDDGDLLLVDVMAPPGSPKVLRVDVDSGDAEPVFTDEKSAFTSAQFGPDDGRLHLTDLVGGRIVSITPDGEDPQVVFSRKVKGRQMLPDDLAFGEDGSMYVSDTSGMGGTSGEIGRVVRVTASGSASVLAGDLPAPNGISFDEDMAGLWVAQYDANRIDYLALDEDGTAVAESHPGIHVDAGRARVDSTSVDADGNIYQAFHGRTAIDVFSPEGEHLAVIDVPDDHALESATNVAIEPGTTDGVITVSGPDGGYVYTFTALGEGSRQSNGG